MKKILLIFFTILYSTLLFSQENQKKLTVTTIESEKEFYTIYLKDNSINYKIISRVNVSKKSCEKIELGKQYTFNLKSVFFFKINDDKNITEITNHINIDCIFIDEHCSVCKEPKKGIYDVYSTENLNGLCYIKSSQ